MPVAVAAAAAPADVAGAGPAAGSNKSVDPVPQSIRALISCGKGFVTNLPRRTAATNSKLNTKFNTTLLI